MNKRGITSFAVCAALLLLVGCAGLDGFFTPPIAVDPATGAAVAAGPSTAETVATGVGVLGPYGELAAGLLLLLQNGYLAVRKFQRKQAAK